MCNLCDQDNCYEYKGINDDFEFTIFCDHEYGKYFLEVINYDFDSAECDYIEIKYCPVCGRRLKVAV